MCTVHNLGAVVKQVHVLFTLERVRHFASLGTRASQLLKTTVRISPVINLWDGVIRVNHAPCKHTARSKVSGAAIGTGSCTRLS